MVATAATPKDVIENTIRIALKKQASEYITSLKTLINKEYNSKKAPKKSSDSKIGTDSDPKQNKDFFDIEFPLVAKLENAVNNRKGRVPPRGGPARM